MFHEEFRKDYTHSSNDIVVYLMEEVDCKKIDGMYG